LDQSIEERPLGPALSKGWRMRCPSCGAGRLFEGYLSVRDDCEFCGEHLASHRADDAPSWLTMLIVGHLLAPLLLTAYQVTSLPIWAHAVIWPTLAMAMILALLPRVKGGVIAFQWAKRMHGFDRAT